MNIKYLIHLSDYHLRTYKRHEEYKEQTIKFLDIIKKKFSNLDKNEVRIVLTGDIVHQKVNVSNEQFRFLAWLLRSLADTYPTILIAGNHDLLENNMDRLDSLTPVVELLDHKDLHYFKESKCYIDNNIVWCNYSIFEENKKPNINEIKKEHKNLRYIGLYHGPVVGAKTDMGFLFDSGKDISDFLGCDFTLMGDIHKRSYFEYGKDNICAYPSSLIQQDYGETVSNHGFLIWDVDTGKYEEYNIDSDYGFYNFKIDRLEDIENNNEELTNK